MEGKMLGKIKEIDIYIEYGHVYLQVELAGQSWGVQNNYPLIPGPNAKNPDEWKIFPLAKYMDDAHVDRLQQMKGKPVEAIFIGNGLQDWRILTEVI